MDEQLRGLERFLARARLGVTEEQRRAVLFLAHHDSEGEQLRRALGWDRAKKEHPRDRARTGVREEDRREFVLDLLRHPGLGSERRRVTDELVGVLDGGDRDVEHGEVLWSAWTDRAINASPGGMAALLQDCAAYRVLHPGEAGLNVAAVVAHRYLVRYLPLEVVKSVTVTWAWRTALGGGR